MSTKAELQAFINTIGTGEPNTALEVRTLLNNLLDDEYPTVISENSGIVGTITAKNSVNTSLTYNVSIVKKGRLVFMSGTVQNSSGSIVSNSNVNDFFFEIIDSDYFPDPSAPNVLFPIYGANFVQLGDTGLKKLYINNVGAGQIKVFNLFYYTLS